MLRFPVGWGHFTGFPQLAEVSISIQRLGPGFQLGSMLFGGLHVGMPRWDGWSLSLGHVGMDGWMGGGWFLV